MFGFDVEDIALTYFEASRGKSSIASPSSDTSISSIASRESAPLPHSIRTHDDDDDDDDVSGTMPVDDDGDDECTW